MPDPNPIVAADPYVAPPVAEKVFPNEFITCLTTKADLEKIFFHIETSPYSAEREEIYELDGKISTDGVLLWSEVPTIPEVLAFFEAAKAVVPAIRAYLLTRNQS